jgi:hypothetical protein
MTRLKQRLAASALVGVVLVDVLWHRRLRARVLRWLI